MKTTTTRTEKLKSLETHVSPVPLYRPSMEAKVRILLRFESGYSYAVLVGSPAHINLIRLASSFPGEKVIGTVFTIDDNRIVDIRTDDTPEA